MGNPESLLPPTPRGWMQLPGQQPSQQLFQGQKGWWQMSRYLMASIITRTFCLYLWWVFVREISKAVMLSRDHADPQISRSIPPYPRRLERVRISCECQELVCKSNIFCCWIWHWKIEPSEGRLATKLHVYHVMLILLLWEWIYPHCNRKEGSTGSWFRQDKGDFETWIQACNRHTGSRLCNKTLMWACIGLLPSVGKWGQW